MTPPFPSFTVTSGRWWRNIASLAAGVGKSTRMRFSSRRNMAGSSSHGRLEAPNTNTRSSLLLRPSICIRSSVFILRLPSWSLAPPMCACHASVLQPRCKSITLTAITSAHDRVELIKEDRRWSVMPCKFKQHPNKFL
eukprot:m.22225 g.22225  ORF g.22225 m.22225 type:complete len:138 (-) comp11218_c0_seq5:1126-1539(-)